MREEPMPALRASQPIPEEAGTTVAAPPVTPVPTVARPKKFSYAKKKLRASASVYILAEFQDKIDLEELPEIAGQVKECARVANGNRYRIQWKRSGPDSYKSGCIRGFGSGG